MECSEQSLDDIRRHKVNGFIEAIGKLGFFSGLTARNRYQLYFDLLGKHGIEW